MPCCMSTTSESQPAWAMTSAEKLDGTPSQLLMTGLPAFHNSRTPFGRAIGILLRFKNGSEADPASDVAPCQAWQGRSADERRLPSCNWTPMAYIVAMRTRPITVAETAVFM